MLPMPAGRSLLIQEEYISQETSNRKITIAGTSLGGEIVFPTRNDKKNNYCYLELDKGTSPFDDSDEELEEKRFPRPCAFPGKKAAARSHVRST